MAYLVGMDEAGYGPNLGPLVISATAWQVSGEPGSVDLYDALAKVVAPGPDRRRLAIADSKRLYKPRGTLRLLERGVLAALASVGRPVGDWQSLWDALEADPDDRRRRVPWYDGYQRPLPTALGGEELGELAATFEQGLHAAGVRLIAFRSRAIFPEEFNDQIDRHGNKATALSRLSLQLLAEVLAPLTDEPVLAVCDKHGGRNRYRELLEEQFPDSLIEVRSEGTRQSVYRMKKEMKKGSGLFYAKHPPGRPGKRVLTPFS